MVGNRLIGEFVGREFLELSPPPPGYVRVDHRAPDIGVEGGPVVDLAPGQVRLGQRRLDQVLGVGPVPGEHDRHPEQGGSAGEYVLAEGAVVVACPRFPVIARAPHADYLT
jgi:hypothetical protein